MLRSALERRVTKNNIERPTPDHNRLILTQIGIVRQLVVLIADIAFERFHLHIQAILHAILIGVGTARKDDEQVSPIGGREILKPKQRLALFEPKDRGLSIDM